ncbi:DUF6671 family protein [Devosia geojensis]|uniref:DUF6671 family protein n=1 Tax=Devosia geojensis TaxID=443610 RepID=UPI000AF6084F|nr:DUF6671 family protein [Devosia geojensis]
MPISDLRNAPGHSLLNPVDGDAFRLAGERAVIATMHGKERVIAPLLAEALGLDCVVPQAFDTDRFGTFTREIERTGTQLDAARAKIAAAFELEPHASVAVASEGSFGPHPWIPFAPLGRELVLLVDRPTGLEITGHDATIETHFAHRIVDGPVAALAFAELMRFPEQGLIVMGCRGHQPAPDIALCKGIVAADVLDRAVRDVVALCGAAFIETDMRAHLNPTRMEAIERATRDLVRRFKSRCPACAYPGYDVTERIPGLPCEWCGEPTQVIKAEVSSCAACGHRIERSVGDHPTADPGQCNGCNP